MKSLKNLLIVKSRTQRKLRRSRTPIALFVMLTAGVALTSHRGAAEELSPAQQNWPGGKWKPYPAMHGSTMIKDLPLQMSDGVTLIADILYPADPAISPMQVCARWSSCGFDCPI